MLVEGSTSTCPRYVADGLSSFTVIDMPDCPVITDAPRLPKKETVNNAKDKTFNAKSIIAICIVLILLCDLSF
uniref:ZP domain-containing protein n=1 Tax=Panagrellus redivivus TaxID=6233 RepID=A0A7E4VKB8_PANRE